LKFKAKGPHKQWLSSCRSLAFFLLGQDTEVWKTCNIVWS